jgi:hypothetical protein
MQEWKKMKNDEVWREEKMFRYLTCVTCYGYLRLVGLCEGMVVFVEEDKEGGRCCLSSDSCCVRPGFGIWEWSLWRSALKYSENRNVDRWRRHLSAPNLPPTGIWPVLGVDTLSYCHLDFHRNRPAPVSTIRVLAIRQKFSGFQPVHFLQGFRQPSLAAEGVVVGP